jgi:hypothetical protein
MDVRFKKTIDVTGAVGTADAGTFVIQGLPQGNLLFLGAVSYVQVDGGSDTHIINDWNGDFSIGTVPQNDVDLADAGEANIIASTPLDAGASNKITPVTRGTHTASDTGVILDNTDGSLELNFNLLLDSGVITDNQLGTFTVTGVVHVVLIVLGDD